MKKITILLCLFLTITTFSQKKEKLKGSKKVTLELKTVGDFDALEIDDDLQIFLVKGDKCSIEIEADDNIHEALGITLTGKSLRLNMAKEISSFKKFQVRINYTADLKTLVCRNESTITALATIELDDITFKAFDYSKLFLNAKTKNFSLMANDKSKIELNLKSESASIELSKSAFAKTLISSTNLKIDLYQKGELEIEGDVTDSKLRMDNDTKFKGKKLLTKTLELLMEGNTSAIINPSQSVSIEASGDAEIELYGNQKIEIKKFNDTAKLIKKISK